MASYADLALEIRIGIFEMVMSHDSCDSRAAVEAQADAAAFRKSDPELFRDMARSHPSGSRHDIVRDLKSWRSKAVKHKSIKVRHQQEFYRISKISTRKMRVSAVEALIEKNPCCSLEFLARRYNIKSSDAGLKDLAIQQSLRNQIMTDDQISKKYKIDVNIIRQKRAFMQKQKDIFRHHHYSSIWNGILS